MSLVLVVEDTPSEMEMISAFLREGGYTVINAGDAKDAMAKANQHHPDVIVTDLVMPGMNGYELCRSLKKNPATEKTPIVVCTSKNQELDRLWAMKQGADAFVAKPFGRDELLRAVKSLI